MWELDYKESWTLKNWCFWTVVFKKEKTLESPLDSKENQPVHQVEAETDAEAETPILWPPDEKNWLIWKDPDAGKDGRQKEKGMTEDERFDGIIDSMEFEQALEVGDGLGSLECHNPWGPKESDTTEWLD